jgi:enoyl-CoA hydratase
VHNGILHLELNDNTSQNSFSLKAARQLNNLIERHVSEKSPVGIIFSATGRVFCSGGNLTDYAAMKEAAEGVAVNQEITKILKGLDECPLPTVANIDGDCWGGGVEVLSAFDHVIASPYVMFGLWQRRIGLTFGWGGGARIASRIGRHETQRLALSAECFSASEAKRIGLVDELAPSALLKERAISWLEQSAKLPFRPLNAIKSRAILDDEGHAFEALWWNDEHRNVLNSRKR